MANQCKFWDCSQSISSLHVFCIDHFDLEESGYVNECPACSRFKFSRNQTCGICQEAISQNLASKQTHYALLKLMDSIDELMIDIGPEFNSISQKRRELLQTLQKNMENVKGNILNLSCE